MSSPRRGKPPTLNDELCHLLEATALVAFFIGTVHANTNFYSLCSARFLWEGTTTLKQG